MGKKITCPGCKGELVFWGEVPKRHKCGLCGCHVVVDNTITEHLDLDNQPVLRMKRRSRPGAVEAAE